MKDLIRSPLQFIRPMTEDEWRDLVLRETCRRIQRSKRGRKAAPVAAKPARRASLRIETQTAESSGWL